LRKKLDDDQIKILQKMFETSGAIKFGEDMIKDFTRKAKEILDQIVFTDEEARKDILALIKKMEKTS
jgi:geranylgeranyl pyrophosphate synthase